MNRKKVLVLYNKKAGVSTSSDDLFEAISHLSENGYETTLYPIVPSMNLTSEDIIRETKGRFDIIMVCGGDGTLNHAINGLLKEKMDIPLAYVPVGSTNDFSKSLYGEHGHTALDIAKYVAGGKIFTYDVGVFNDSYFNYVAGFGAFPMVSFTTPQDLKNNLGYGAYVLNFLTTIPDGLSYKKHCVVKHDGIVEEGDFMFGLITNSISVAGMKPGIIKSSSLNDGVFEATLVRSSLNPKLVAEMIHAMNSENPHADGLVTFQLKDATFEFEDDVPWTLDGEDGGVAKDVSIHVETKAVRIFVPDAD